SATGRTPFRALRAAPSTSPVRTGRRTLRSSPSSCGRARSSRFIRPADRFEEPAHAAAILDPRRALDPRRDVDRVRAGPPDRLADVLRPKAARDEQRDRPAAAFEEGPVERHPGPSGYARDGRIEENAGASVETRVRRN